MKRFLLRFTALIIFLGLIGATAFYSFNIAHTFGFDSPFDVNNSNPDFTTGASDDTENGSQTGSDAETGDSTSGFTDPGTAPDDGGINFNQAPWDGASRVTVLIMGLDYRDWESGEGAPRTDSMIVLTIDPLTKTAGMLSIPRDLWVPIPGFEYERINVAYRLGVTYDLPGGGPGLAVATVEQLLGVPIDYYAQIDFTTFERMIDEIGGLKVDVPYEIEVVPLYSKNHKILKPGVQTLPGDVALAYARSRKSEGADFDRAERQQQIILAVRERILSFDLIPILISKSGVLYDELSSGVDTNMTLEESIRLGLLAKDIALEDIRRGVIDADAVNLIQTPAGDNVLKPLTDQIRILRDYVFTAPSMVSDFAENATDEERMQAEQARIAVYNGTFTSGLARSTADYLIGMGAIIPEELVGDGVAHSASLIIDYTGNPYTVSLIVDRLNIQRHRIFLEYDPAHQVDVEVFLGEDWAGNNDLP